MKKLIALCAVMLLTSCCRIYPNRYSYSINDPDTPAVYCAGTNIYITIDF